MLSHYRALARREAERGDDPHDSNLSFIVNTKVGDLLALSGDRLKGVEAFYDDLSRTAANPTRVQFEKALMYSRFRLEQNADRPGLTAKAIELLQRISDERIEPYSRRALATLASLQADGGNFAAARTALAEYLRAYPYSDYAWSARVALGRAAVRLGESHAAVEAFHSAAAMADIPDVARVVSLFLASETRAELGQIDQALRDAVRALELWDDRLGHEYSIEPWADGRSQPLALHSGRIIEKSTIERRVDALTLAAASPVGAAAEQARRFVSRGRFDAAISLLDSAGSNVADALTAGAARTLRTEAQLRQILALVDADRGDRSPGDAIRELEAFDDTPADFPTVVGRMALATLLSFRNGTGDAARADEVMRTALDGWLERQPPATSPRAGTLEADVAAIRAQVFRPHVDGVYDEVQRWNAFQRPSQLPPYLLVDADVLVGTTDGARQRVSVRSPLPGFDSIIFVDRSNLELLAAAIIALGGTQQGTPVSVMQPPNLPIGPSVRVRTLWNRYFAMRPGHWGGWEFETYPVITRIDFLDAARTHAAVHVTIGFGGTAVMLSKLDGIWRATGLSGRWVT